MSNEDLPRGWCTARLPDVAHLNPPMPDTRRAAEELVSFVPMAAVEPMSGRLDPNQERAWGEVQKGYRRFQSGDVLFAKITPCMENGKVAVARGLVGGVGAGSTEFHVLRPRDGVASGFVLWYLLRDDVRREARARMTGTAGQLRVPEAFLEDLHLPVAPSPEQHRIVSAIESYFTRLDDAVASLERVRRNLKRYRASVLKAAVEGRLVPTEAELARKEGRDYEPAEVLLKRILAERRRRWEEAELAKLKAAGKPPKDDRWKTRYKEPVEPDTEGLFELPEGWCWASVDQLGAVSGGLTMNAKRSSNARRVPYLRVANVYANELRLDEVKEIGVSEGEIDRVTLRRGDLLVVEGNGSVDQIGRVALWDGSIDPCVHQNHLIKVRFSGTTLPVWALWWLLSPRGRRTVEAVASSTSGLHTLSLTKVSTLTVPVPPEAEQGRITAEVDRLLSLADEVNREGSYARHRSGRLRQSILKWAFEGRLVDQDPTDEPASALLERVKAERAEATPKPNRVPGRKTRVTA